MRYVLYLKPFQLHVNVLVSSSLQDPLSHRIIEKRRRDRMNNCLADLSVLIPSPYLKQVCAVRSTHACCQHALIYHYIRSSVVLDSTRTCMLDLDSVDGKIYRIFTKIHDSHCRDVDNYALRRNVRISSRKHKHSISTRASVCQQVFC